MENMKTFGIAPEVKPGDILTAGDGADHCTAASVPRQTPFAILFGLESVLENVGFSNPRR